MTYYPQSATGLNYITYPAGPTAAPSTTVTANASANTKGAYTEIVASADFTTNGVIVEFPSTSASAATYLLDIATGAAGSETVVIPDIIIEASSNAGGSLMGHGAIFFPLAVASGVRMAARCQSSLGGASINVALTLIAAGGVPGCAAFTAHGINAATSSAAVIDPGGTIDTKGAYTELDASTSAVAQYAVMVLSSGANGSPTSYQWAFDIATGAAASEIVLVPDLRVSMTNTVGSVEPKATNFLTYIPASTRLAIRASCNGNNATDRKLQAALYTAVAPTEPSSGGGGSSTWFGGV